MSRAMVCFERQPDASWKPVAVFLATADRLEGQTLPGDPDREAWLQHLLLHAVPPRTPDGSARGTWEDWIGWALDRFANGHTTWTAETVPTETVEGLYQREVVEPAP